MDESLTIRSITFIYKIDEQVNKQVNFHVMPTLKGVRLNDLRIKSQVNKLLSLQDMMGRSCVQTAWKMVPATPNTATTSLMGQHPLQAWSISRHTRHQLSPATTLVNHTAMAHLMGSGKTVKLPSFPPTMTGCQYHPHRTSTMTEKVRMMKERIHQSFASWLCFRQP